MNRTHILLLLFSLFLQKTLSYAEEPVYGIRGNLGAVNTELGIGELGNLFQIPKNSGVRLGGL